MRLLLGGGRVFVSYRGWGHFAQNRLEGILPNRPKLKYLSNNFEEREVEG